MNYKTVKDQLHQIIITEVAKYFQKALTPAGLSLEDLKCLEIIGKMSQFEQDIKFDEPHNPAENVPISDLLKFVKQSQNDPKP